LETSVVVGATVVVVVVGAVVVGATVVVGAVVVGATVVVGAVVVGATVSVVVTCIASPAPTPPDPPVTAVEQPATASAPNTITVPMTVRRRPCSTTASDATGDAATGAGTSSKIVSDLASGRAPTPRNPSTP
jgi:hypothetical protein